MGGVSKTAVEAEAARPMKYFSHDADAAEDMKTRKLLRRYGFEGYGRWWRLCEFLASEHGHRLDLEDADTAEIVADTLLMEVPDMVEFVLWCVNVGLLCQDETGTVYSERMNTNAFYFGKRRAAGRKGMENRWGNK